MPNRFQLKRTTTTGLLPNVSNSSNTSYIAAGELAINLTDRKLLSSNGSATFEIGANLASLSVAGVVAADYYTAANNGNGTNYKVGDDAWIGDINVADTVNLKGQQNSSVGYIRFATAPTSLGYNGTSLIYSSNVSFGNTSVSGAITATGDITAFFSDDRLKDRIGNIPFAVDKVKQLNGFYYTPNEVAQSYGYEDKIHVGVSAQEVFLTVPEAIAPAPIDPQYMTVRYEKLIPLLIQAIKEQQTQIEELKQLIEKK